MKNERIGILRVIAAGVMVYVFVKLWPILMEVGSNLEATHPKAGQLYHAFVIANMILIVACILYLNVNRERKD